jgi:hypothetical protein
MSVSLRRMMLGRGKGDSGCLEVDRAADVSLETRVEEPGRIRDDVQVRLFDELAAGFFVRRSYRAPSLIPSWR